MGDDGRQQDLDGVTECKDAREPDTLVSTAADSEGDSGQESAPDLALGTRAGRYIILEILGSGGMGVVYKAYDPELDRRIALKLLRVRSRSGSSADRARDRLLREAQALAQLSHPNVVSAFDVGTLGNDVFVAMELVEGRTLKSWLLEEKPSVRQIVEVLAAAGRGLAAAHQAGLIHRDFKPDNVIIGDDGRVRVLDFGLARAAATEDGETPRAPRERSGSSVGSEPSGSHPSGQVLSTESRLYTSLTQDGAMVGTPGYMAPEQYLDTGVTEQTDQFSFCVALYESLYGRKPHKAKSFQELKEKVATGQVEPPPSGAKVPVRLWRIIQRGMSLAREDRFASMESLLVELERDPRIFWRRVTAAVVVLILLGASFVGAALWQAQKQRLCQGAQDRLTGTWDSQIRQALRQGFLATGLSFAQNACDRVEATLDQYTGAWVKMRTSACEATHLLGEQSERLLDLRMQCLDRRLSETKALVTLFAQGADAELVAKAAGAVQGLPTLADCADAETLTAAVAPPRDPALRARVEQLRGRLDEVVALERAGKYQQGMQGAEAAAQEAMALDYVPVQAEALFMRSRFELHMGKKEAAEKSMMQSIRLAAACRDDKLMAKALVKSIYVIGYLQARYREAYALEPVVEAAAIRAGSDPVLLSDGHYNMGIVLYQQGKYVKSLERFRQALALRQKALPADDQRITASYVSLGNVLDELGEYAEARKEFNRALVIGERSLGPGHPDIGLHLNALGNTYYLPGDPERALPYYNRALTIWEAAYGTEHPRLASVLNNLGNALRDMGRYREARAVIERSLKIRQKSLGPQHPELAGSWEALGDLFSDEGQDDEALDAYQHMLELSRRRSPQHPRVALALSRIGNSYLKQKKLTLAIQHFQAALKIVARFDSESKPQTHTAFAGLASCYLAQGEPNRARSLLEPLVKARQLAQGDPGELAEAQALLARALWAAGTQKARALSLAQQARQVFASSSDRRWGEKLLALEHWLRKRGGHLRPPQD